MYAPIDTGWKRLATDTWASLRNRRYEEDNLKLHLEFLEDSVNYTFAAANNGSQLLTQDGPMHNRIKVRKRTANHVLCSNYTHVLFVFITQLISQVIATIWILGEAKKSSFHCPEGKLELGFCRLGHLLAVSLSWLGIFQFSPSCLIASGVGMVRHFLTL